MPNLAAIFQEINRGVDSTPKALAVSNRPGEIGLKISFLELLYHQIRYQYFGKGSFLP